MATLQNYLLPSNNVFADAFSSSKFNILNSPHFIFHPSSTIRLRSLNDTKASTQQYPQTHLSLTTKSSKYCSLSTESGTNFARCLALLNSKSVNDCRQIHAQVLKLYASNDNSWIGNKLAMLYSKNESSLDNARKMFDEIPEPTLPTYAALILAYCRSNRWDDLFSLFRLMVDEGILPDKYLVPTILKACSGMRLLRTGKMIHGYVIRKDLVSDVFVGNALIDFYSNCEDLRFSIRVFDSINERDVVSWTALVSAYMEEGLLDQAMEVFNSMKLDGMKPDLISWNALVSGFARNGEIGLAFQYLREMQEKGLRPRVNSWNGIISGCAQNGYFEDALDAFNKMLLFPENPNFVTIASILPACAGLKDLQLGRAVHAFALKHELCVNNHVEGSLIDMYSKCGCVDHAENVFTKAETKNITMWNEVIAAYVNQRQENKALELLRSMQHEGQKPDIVTYNTLIAGYARNGRKSEAYELLSQMLEMDLMPNVVSFNVLISGFQQYGLSYEALKIFHAMQFPDNFLNEVFILLTRPNSITVTAALSACADLRLLRGGKEIHGYMLRSRFESNIYVSSALVDMYTKCSDIGSARKVFQMIKDKNVICWNVLIAGYIEHRQAELAFELLWEMLVEGIEPSLVTFFILLPACGEMGALRVGRQLHSYIVKSQVTASSNSLASGLSDMYASCGNIKEAKLLIGSENGEAGA